MRERCYRRDYQVRHDIDWFASYNGVPIHVASNGGTLPNIIKRGFNKQIQRLLAEEEFRECDVSINDSWINELLIMQENLNVETYLQSFIEFARKGFVSIDNAIIEGEYIYKIVVYPKHKSDLFKRHELPSVGNELQHLELNLW